MKKIFYLFNVLFSILLTVNCSAQNSYHRQDPNADKFVGTWKWGDSNNGLILIMKKENNIQVLNNDTDRFDILIGFHKVYKNGVVIEDSTAYSNTSFIDKKKTFIASTEDSNSNLLVAFMTHLNKNIRIKISYIDPTHIKITDVRNQEGVRLILPGQTAPSSSIDIPNDIILTKQ